MECQFCGGRVVPAGVSKKTGKRYEAFCSQCKQKQVGGVPLVEPSLPHVSNTSHVLVDKKAQQRAWSRSKNLQIAMQGYLQRSPEMTLEEAYEKVKSLERFADSKVGFDRSADEPSEEISVEDIPF